MKSVFNATSRQTIVGDQYDQGVIGQIWTYRPINVNSFRYAVAGGTSSQYLDIPNFFQNLDNQ